MKKVKAKPVDDYRQGLREDIAQMNRILDKFSTEEGFEEFVELNSIRLGIGKEDDIDLYFSPRTWEAAERFLMFCICHLIESDGLEEFPLYDEMLTRYAAALGMERGEFE